MLYQNPFISKNQAFDIINVWTHNHITYIADLAHILSCNGVIHSVLVDDY